MPIRRWTLCLLATLAHGQEVRPIQEVPVDPWTPAWQAMVRSDQLDAPAATGEAFSRMNLQLRLRWALEAAGVRWVLGTRSAIGSDGNRFNPPRWDQQPSNGSQLDLAHGEVTWVAPRTFAVARLGLQENGLVTSEALWDRDLRFLGAGAVLGCRGTGDLLQEASVRFAAGRVRNILGGRGDLAAGQVVLKMDTGPISWLAHLDRWSYAWDPGVERLRRLPGGDPLSRQHMTLDAGGAGLTWNTWFPLEARWFRSINRVTRDDSEEVRVSVGSRQRPWWPQVSYTWQRLSSTGTLYPVNGDEWWFYRSARGPRLEVAWPLPGKWVLSMVHLRQQARGDTYTVTRRLITLTRHF